MMGMNGWKGACMVEGVGEDGQVGGASRVGVCSRLG